MFDTPSGRFCSPIICNNLLTPMKNDQFFISHRHHVDDGLPNLEESHTQASISDDEASISSVIRTSALAMHTPKAPMPIFTQEVRCSRSRSAYVNRSIGYRKLDCAYYSCPNNSWSPCIPSQYRCFHETTSCCCRRYIGDCYSPFQYPGSVSSAFPLVPLLLERQWLGSCSSCIEYLIWY